MAQIEIFICPLSAKRAFWEHYLEARSSMPKYNSGKKVIQTGLLCYSQYETQPTSYFYYVQGSTKPSTRRYSTAWAGFNVTGDAAKIK